MKLKNGRNEINKNNCNNTRLHSHSYYLTFTSLLSNINKIKEQIKGKKKKKENINIATYQHGHPTILDLKKRKKKKKLKNKFDGKIRKLKKSGKAR